MKKIISIILVVAMLATMGISAMASASNEPTSDAAIAFQGAGADGNEVVPGVPEGIYCPSDDRFENNPYVPGDLYTLGTLDLDFGLHYLPLVDTSYTSGGGIVVAALRAGWVVNVGVSEFRLVANNAETLVGFDMVLDGEIPGQFRNNMVTAGDATLTANTGSVFFATGQSGLSGTEFDAILNVPANSAELGRSQAILDWTFAPGVDVTPPGNGGGANGDNGANG